jgi:hypothetical protein
MLGIDVGEAPVKVVKPRPAKSAASKVNQSRSSSSILPPPPAVTSLADDLAGDIPSSPPVPLYNLTQGVIGGDESDQDQTSKQKADRRHWNYDSDEGADMNHGSRQGQREKSTPIPVDATITETSPVPNGSIHVTADAAQENGKLRGMFSPCVTYSLVYEQPRLAELKLKHGLGLKMLTTLPPTSS